MEKIHSNASDWDALLTFKQKIILMSRWTIFFFFVFCLKASAGTFAQGTLISLNCKGASFQKIVSTISEKSNVHFLFSPEMVPAGKIDFRIHDVPLGEVLDRFLGAYGLTYKLVNGGRLVVILRERKISVEIPLPQRTVKGRVVDEQGKPLSGVSVVIAGSKTGTNTDADGYFSLSVLEGDALVFSYVGFIRQTLPVRHSDFSNVMLKVDQTLLHLNEVVVIGYGTIKRRDLTGAITSVKSEDIMRTPSGNPLESIEGRVPGLDATISSGKAGSNMNMLIRGTRTISGSSDPLYIIDGVQGGSPSNLNAADISSIDVLKDASATAIYGSQGANGVIIITTRQGSGAKTIISYNTYMGIDGWTQYPEPRLGDSYLNLRRQAYLTSGTWNSISDDSKIFSTSEMDYINEGKWINWVDLLKKNGFRNSQSLSVSGGGDKTKIYFSGSYFRSSGMLRYNNFTRYNALINVDQKLFKGASAGIQGNVIYSVTNQRGTDPFSRAMYTSPLGDAYDSLGNINLYPQSGALSPLADERGASIATNTTNNTYAFVNGHIQVEPFLGLVFRSVLGASFTFSRNGVYYDSTSLEEVNNLYSYAAVTNSNTKFYTWDNVLTYNHAFGAHALTLTALSSYTNNHQETFFESGTGVSYSSQLFWNLAGTSTANRSITSNYTGTATMSYAGRLQYSYLGRYLLTLTERIDGASRLAEGHKWAGFPSAAIGWRLSDEKFMKSFSWLNDLKLRASLGVAGNSGIPAYGTQSTLTTQSGTFDNSSASGYVFNATIGNSTLGWERSETMNLGFDFSIFNSRISGSMDYYHTNTSRILLSRSLPSSLGISSSYENLGSTLNRGLEFQLFTRNIETRNFKWQSVFNFSTNHQKITKLVSGSNIMSSSDVEGSSLLLGHPINSFYNYKKLGIWQTSEADKASKVTYGGTAFSPGDIKLADLNGDGKISADSDRTYIGHAEPKWSFSMQNTFIYKHFDLSCYFIVRWGQMIKAEFLGRYNPEGYGNNGPAYFNYWTPENSTNDFPRPNSTKSLSSYPGYTTLYYVDGSYLKLKTLTLGYTLPEGLIRNASTRNLSFRVYVTCNNIFVKAKSHLIKYYDPERGGSEDAPLSRQLVMGVNLSF